MAQGKNCIVNCLLGAMQQGCYNRPAGTDVSTGQSIQILAFRSVAAVRHKVNSIKPGRSSSHSVKVRIGIWFLSKLPGLFVLKPCDDFIRIGRKQRSMLEELIFKRRL